MTTNFQVSTYTLLVCSHMYKYGRQHKYKPTLWCTLLTKLSIYIYIYIYASLYIYAGVFNEEYPKRLGYCTDITKLGMYTPKEPDMLYYDIQFG